MKPKNDAEGIASPTRSWVMTAVEPSEFAPAFAYSVGFQELFGHPEVIVFGLGPDQAHALLSVVAEDLSVGKSFDAPGEYEGVLREGKVGFRPVHESQHEVYVGDAMERHRVAQLKESLRVIQLFWPDRQGLFPYQLGCDAAVASQQRRLEFPLTPSERDDLLGLVED